MFYWQEDPSKIQRGRKSGNWLKVEILAVKGPMAVISIGSAIFQSNISKKETFRYRGYGRTSRFA